MCHFHFLPTIIIIDQPSHLPQPHILIYVLKHTQYFRHHLVPRRNSVSLIFVNLPLNCPDASFNILSDSISFFCSGAFEIDMHAEEHMMEALAKRIKEKDTATALVDVDGSPAPQSGSKFLLVPPLSSAGISAEEVVAPNVLPAPIHKPILSSVRRPPGVMPVNLKPNMFCKPEQGVQPTLGMKGKLPSVLGPRTKATQPARSPLEMYTPSQPTQAIKPPSGTLKSRLLKLTASSLSRAPPVKISTVSNTAAASKTLHLPLRFATVGMASELPIPHVERYLHLDFQHPLLECQSQNCPT
ncbi:hypothetical protein BDR04DRAFT_1142118 [Suillus decipiens]|nr:hypothetical protein BDR04DRAFT_1142118 [Suillus decipiens]